VVVVEDSLLQYLFLTEVAYSTQVGKWVEREMEGG
jgi:hypothetical protein